MINKKLANSQPLCESYRLRNRRPILGYLNNCIFLTFCLEWFLILKHLSLFLIWSLANSPLFWSNTSWWCMVVSWNVMARGHSLRAHSEKPWPLRLRSGVNKQETTAPMLLCGWLLHYFLDSSLKSRLRSVSFTYRLTLDCRNDRGCSLSCVSARTAAVWSGRTTASVKCFPLSLTANCTALCVSLDVRQWTTTSSSLSIYHDHHHHHRGTRISLKVGAFL